MNFVLIPGAWLGAWIWDSVAEGLRAAGHDALAITLPGMTGSEDVADIGLETHVQAALAAVTDADLTDVVVVGQSYSGIVAGQVADRLPDRVVHTVYVEAFLPHDGRSMLDGFGPGAPDELRSIEANGGRWPAPTAEELAHQQGITDELRATLLSRFVGQPGRTVSEPARLEGSLAEKSATFVACTGGDWLSPDVEAMRDRPTWTIESLPSSHWPMISAPEQLTDLLVRAAERSSVAGATA